MAKKCQIVAEVNGGKDGNSHRFANFAPQCAAANTGTVTELAQTRRLHGSDAPLRYFRHCTAVIGETAAKAN